MTREDMYWAALLGEGDPPPSGPITRMDFYLARLLKLYDGDLPEPISLSDIYAKRYAEQGGGGGGGGTFVDAVAAIDCVIADVAEVAITAPALYAVCGPAIYAQEVD